MSLPSVAEHEALGCEEDELALLIREACRRQRRRRLRVTLLTAVVGSAALATTAASGWLSAPAPSGTAGAPSATRSVTRCPASPARRVSNATFAATVIGDGPVRLGVGNVYEPKAQRFLVYEHRAGSWGGIEAIWWVSKRAARGPVIVRGVPLGKQRPLEVQPSHGGQGPGAGPLTLSGPSDAFPAYPGAASAGAVYAGSLWVRAGGCYGVEISGRGISERLVFAVAMRRQPYRPTPGGS
jgi:hypothetical protein